MKRYVIVAFFGLAACGAGDPDLQEAKQICDQLEATDNFTYRENNMTPQSCLCTMEFMRKSLEDNTWSKFIQILNGEDPFPAASLPVNSPVIRPGDPIAPEVQPQLRAILDATQRSRAICLGGSF